MMSFEQKMKENMKARMHKVHSIRRGQLSSGNWFWIGYCRISGKIIHVASQDQAPGGWFSYQKEGK
jgi:hypothetical protein